MAVYIPSFQDKAAFRGERFNPVVLAESERVRVIEACFEPGQFIPVHKPGIDMTLVVLEGTGRLFAGDREQALTPGALAFVPAGEARGVRADTRLVILHVVTPPPREGDHDQVAAGLEKGGWK